MTTRRWIAVVAGVLACAGAVAAQAPAKVDFATDVLPIFREHCVECHGPLKQRGGMRIDRKSSVMKAFSRRVVPGSSVNSFLYHRVAGHFGPMPPDGGLKPEQIATIKAWIDQGAEWPDALANEVDLPPPNAQAVAMVASLRENDLAGFMKAAQADPSLLNARGPEGSTPFMYAVLYAGPATLTRLLAMGADPNRKNDANATALMWAATNLEKTRVLLGHGAEVNAKSDDMHTALMIAARKPGNAATVKALLEHGANANPNAKPETESSPLIEAVTAGDAATTELLLAHGADAKTAGETGLSLAASTGCPRCLELVAAKITDKDVYTGSLQDVAVFGDVKTMQMMLDHGADAKAYDGLGRTALMYAAVSDMAPLDAVKLLVAHGADVNAKDKHPNGGDEGVTALDIAKRNGDTPVVRFLAASGAKTDGVTPAVLTPRLKNELRLAVSDSLPLLQRADASFADKAGCVSCHNDSMTEMTTGLARKKGFEVDERAAAAALKANAENLMKLRDRMHQGFVIPVGDSFSEGILGYILLGLKAEGYKADLNTDAAAMDILSRQQPDGEWFAPAVDTRPPLCLEHIGQTALAMRSLQLYAPKTDAAVYRRAIAMAAAWMATAKSYSNDDRSWRLTGLAWAGTYKIAEQKAMHELLAAQKADGGWSDLPTMESSAYATGKSLVALESAGMSVTAPAYKRGVAWLLSHQQQDGTWYVQTRALAFQPYFDAGFPGGPNQWISAAGTNWAVEALALAAPEGKKVETARVGAVGSVRGGSR
jgi:ankyrin repeat protein/mono/diheme cytochrome c family protein